MGVLFPSEAIGRRWSGALQARLRRAPLEEFLMVHGITPASRDAYQDRDNLVRATVFIVDVGVVRYFHECRQQLVATQLPVLARAACLVSRSLAELIQEPSAWRTAALVSGAQLLSARMGLNAAAIASASLLRQFEVQLVKPASAADARISEIAAAAIRCGTQGDAVVSAVIAKSLACESERHSVGTGDVPLERRTRV